MVVGGSITNVLLSPDFRVLVAVRETRAATPATLLQNMPEQAPGEATVIVWKFRTRRAVVARRRDLRPSEKAKFWLRGWMGKKGLAVATVMIQSNNGANGASGNAAVAATPNYAFLSL